MIRLTYIVDGVYAICMGLPIDPDGFGELAKEDEKDWAEHVEKVKKELPEQFVVPDIIGSKDERFRLAERGSKEWQWYWKMRGRSAAFVFKAGERIEGTLLTVVGQGYQNRYGKLTWKFVRCKCDCGNEVDIPYQHVYAYPPRYSCGCKVRRHPRMVDHTGLSVTRNGRTLTVLYWDNSAPGNWVYLCDCCAETGIVPYGMGGTIPTKLKAIASRPCPNAASPVVDSTTG